MPKMFECAEGLIALDHITGITKKSDDHYLVFTDGCQYSQYAFDIDGREYLLLRDCFEIKG